MKAKPIRICIECGKEHDTGVENKLTGEFNRIDKCIDCLMSKCSFKFESSPITLDDLNEIEKPDENFKNENFGMYTFTPWFPRVDSENP